MSRCILALVIALSGPAFAGSTIIGNGGDVFVCDQGKRAILLDFWGATLLEEVKIKLADPAGYTYQEKVVSLIEKVKMRFPRLAELLTQEFDFFERKKSIQSNIELPNIDDSFNKARPKGCEQRQVANQTQATFLMWGEPWYLIDADLWGIMSEFDRAGLVIHEILYRIGLRYGLQHSRGIQLLVALLFSDDYTSIPDQAWLSAFMESRIPFYEIGLMRVPLFEGGLLECVHVPGTTHCEREGAPYLASSLAFNGNSELVSVRYSGTPQTIEWFSDGSVKVEFKVSKVVFRVEEGTGTRMMADGVLRLHSPGQDGSISYFWVNGTFDVLQNRYCGNVRRVTQDGVPKEEIFQFCGPLSQMK